MTSPALSPMRKPKHKMGKTLGYRLHADGSINPAPCLYEPFEHTDGEPCIEAGSVLPDSEPSGRPWRGDRPKCKHSGRWILVSKHGE